MRIVKLDIAVLTAVIILTVSLSYPGFSLLTENYTIHCSGSFSPSVFPPLHTEGRYIKDEYGNKIILRGVWKGLSLLEGSISAFAYDGEPYDDWTARTTWRPNAVRDVLLRLKEWGFNSYAEQIWADWWIYNSQALLGEPRNTITTDTKYRDAIRSLLAIANELGIYVQIRMYSPEAGWGGVGEGRVEAPFPAGPYTHDGHIFPNKEAFAQFWYNVTYELADYSNVIFTLYDEPSLDEQLWFDAAELSIQKIRQAEQDAGGYTHIIMVHFQYCGDCLWIERWINQSRPTQNIVFSNHIYRYKAIEPGTFGYIQNTDIDFIRGYLARPGPWAELNGGVGYKYIIDTYNVPLMVTAIGAEDGETDDGEYAFFEKTLTVLNEWEIGYWAFLWYDIDSLPQWRLMNNPSSRAYTSANRVGQALISAIASRMAS